MANIYVVNEKTRAMFLQFNDTDGNIHYMVNDKVVTKDEGNRRFEAMKAVNGFAHHPLNTEEDLNSLAYDLSGEYQSLALMLQRGVVADEDASTSEEALKLCATMLNIVNQILDCKMVINNHPVNIILDKPLKKWVGFEASSDDNDDADYDDDDDDEDFPYYLVKMTVNIADEDKITKIAVVNRPDMPEFLSQPVDAGFGNLDMYGWDNDEDKYLCVADIAKCTAITEREYEIICRLGLSDISSGSWSI